MKEYFDSMFIGMVAVVIYMIFIALRRGSRPSPYDERQLIAQGKGYKLALFTLMGTLAIYALYWNGAEKAVLLPPMAITMCICCAAFAFGAYCVVKDAYLPLTSRPVLNVVMFTLFGLVLTGIGAFKVVVLGALENGYVGMPVLGLVLGVLALGLAVVLAVKTARDRKENEDE